MFCNRGVCLEIGGCLVMGGIHFQGYATSGCQEYDTKKAPGAKLNSKIGKQKSYFM